MSTISRTGCRYSSLICAQGALRRRIEEADALHEIAEQLDADREAVDRREHVEDAAAHGEGPRIFDDRGAQIAAAREQLDGAVAIELLLGLDEIDERSECGASDHAPAQRLDRGHEHLAARALRESEQRRHAAEHDAAVGRHVGVGARVIGRQAHDARLGEWVALVGARHEERQVSLQPFGAFLVGDHDEERPTRGGAALGQMREHDGDEGAARVVKLRALTVCAQPRHLREPGARAVVPGLVSITHGGPRA